MSSTDSLFTSTNTPVTSSNNSTTSSLSSSTSVTSTINTVNAQRDNLTSSMIEEVRAVDSETADLMESVSTLLSSLNTTLTLYKDLLDSGRKRQEGCSSVSQQIVSLNQLKVDTESLLSDIIMNYRTVISLGEKNVEFVLEKYYGLLDGPNREGIKRAHISGILYGYSQSVRFIFVALSFYFAILILENSEHPDEERRDVFTAVYIMFVGAIGSGVAVSQMPSLGRAKAAASKIFLIIKEKSEIDSRRKADGNGHTIQQGSIKLTSVGFKYPSRNKKVLQNFNLDIRGNESVALVGHSGSGKSTIASLLLRFYDKQRGQLLIDGRDIESYPVKHIRDQIAIVMQEPLLFNESIKDNIKYGCPDATNAQVLKAATQANCLDFVQSSQDQFAEPGVVEQLN